ncbi:patatin-like phospholipase family protein [Frondihabitans peucedani]|uniref:Patatin-like phospholipase family protein n=1 Tax=Frondihabitans peucedani TaxID=598626 RepID=A0ABP8E494_9MICO
MTLTDGTQDATGHLPDIERQALTRGADLVLEGGGVKGIGLAGAVITLADAGYVFPRVGGTSAGAIVACLVAAYQTRKVPLSQIRRDMEELDYTRFRDQSRFQRTFGHVGRAASLLAHQGVYRTDYLASWLAGKLDPLGIRTFRDLRIDGDTGTGLPPERRYRLVVHTSDLSRKCLVRLPWDLPKYLLPETASEESRLAAIDGYRVVDAVRASMSIPWFFRPFTQSSDAGSCTWVDGGLLQNFPITVFNRNDGRLDRWPTFGVKLSGRPRPTQKERAVLGNIAELRAVAATALGQWNRYSLSDSGVDDRTVWVDTDDVSATDFGISRDVQERLYANGVDAARTFITQWEEAKRRKDAAVLAEARARLG